MLYYVGNTDWIEQAQKDIFMIGRIIRGLAPVFAMAAAAGVSGCDGVNISINDKEGVPLSELDLSGKAPTELVLAGPDEVVVTEGATLDIDVSGDQEAVDALRFTLDETTLGIMREKGDWKGKGKATVRVTMPPLEKLVVAGSGSVEAPRMAGSPEVTIAGSGKARAARVDADKLEVTIAGSGSYEAAGAARSLELTIAGSGSASMAGLQVDDAEITIAGSGDAEFASDGTVEAKVMGSGDVRVTGTAKCTINSMGSGKLHCSPSGATRAANEAPPTPPAAPEPPMAPEAPAE